MKLAYGIRIGAWTIVGINLLMALGAIGVFMRMTPAIAEIISKNERSLEACEEMLAALAFASCNKQETESHLESFKNAYLRAHNNITEPEEPQALNIIKENFRQAFKGEKAAIILVTQATLELGNINRKAMAVADKNAQQLGRGGAWGIVFMAACSFLAGVIFIRNLNHKLLEPLDEMKNVLIAHLGGETRRRCTGANLHGDVRAIFANVNSVLDRSMHDTFKK